MREYFADRYSGISRPKGHKKINYKVLWPNLPIKNFIIMGDGRKYRVAYFAWNYNKDQELICFRTENSELIAMFKSQFDQLECSSWRPRQGNYDVSYSSKPIFYGYSNADGFVDKHGHWAMIAYSMSLCKSRVIVKSISKQEISFEERSILIKGSIYDLESSDKRPINHESYVDNKSDNPKIILPGKNSILINYIENGDEPYGYALYEMSSYGEARHVKGFFTHGPGLGREELAGVEINEDDLNLDDNISREKLIARIVDAHGLKL